MNTDQTAATQSHGTCTCAEVPSKASPAALVTQCQAEANNPTAAAPAKKENINGKEVLYRDAKTVLNMKSHFLYKKLSTGPVLNLGDACVYSCLYCYVECIVLKFIFGLLGARNHEDVVIRRKDALLTLKRQLAANREKNNFHVVYSSSLVDIAATLGLLHETVAACLMILENTVWDIRLLSKSSFLPKLVALIPPKYKHRLILGVSTGTFDDELGRVIEVGTPWVSKRVESLHWLQDNNYRTFAMVCPSLPQVDYDAFAEKAKGMLRYDRCEHVWAEVINVRGDSFDRTIAGLKAAKLLDEMDRLIKVCGEGAEESWQEYARATFEAHKKVVGPDKLRFMQYVNRQKDLAYWIPQKTYGAVILGTAEKRAAKKAAKV